MWHGEDIRINDHTSGVNGHEFLCFTVPNCSCDCACNLCDILSGTYMYLNIVKHYPVSFILFKKPSACVYKPTTGAVPPQSVPIGLVTIFTTNRMASCPPQIKLLCTCLGIQHKMCSQCIDMYTIQTEAATVVVFPFVQCGLVAPLVVDGSPDSVSPLVVWGLMVSQVGGLVSQVVVPCAVRSW